MPLSEPLDSVSSLCAEQTTIRLKVDEEVKVQKMVYVPVYVMFLMRANPLRGQVGEGWALEIETFLGPVKFHRAVRRVSFGAQKSRGRINHRSINT